MYSTSIVQYVSVVNMVKSCCSAAMLAVICLSVILVSLEADAQSTVDETTSCGASTLDEVVDMVNKMIASNQQVVRMIASNQQQNSDEIRDMKQEISGLKRLLESGSVETNQTRLEDIVRDTKDEIKDEIRDVKKVIASECEETNETRLETVVREMKDELQVVKRLLEKNCEHVTVNPLKQALVSALVFNCTPLLIQQHDGSDFFNRSWAEFRVGFGDPSGNYWLGNDLLSQLTANNSYKLRFDLQSRSNGNWYYAEYSTFRVLTEADNYTLQVSGYSGNAGNAFSYHNGTMFTTYDRDNDLYSSNCALQAAGGFWYKACYKSGVNVASNAWAFHWYYLPGGSNLQTSRMWLECK